MGFLRYTISFTILSFIIHSSAVVAQVPIDTAVILSYYEDGKKIYPSNKDSAQMLFEEGLALAESVKYERGLFVFYRALSSLEANRANVDACVSYVTKGMKLVIAAKMPVSNQIDLQINLGAAYINAGQPGNALRVYIEAEEMASSEGMLKKRALLLNNIGAIYRRLQRYDEAVRIYHQSLSLRQKLNDSMGMANNYHNLASVYAHADRYDEALEASQKAGELYVLLKSDSDILLTQLSRAHALYELGQEEEAYAYLLPLSQKESLPFTLQSYTLLYITLAEYYLKRNDFTKAEKALDFIRSDLHNSDLLEYKIQFEGIQSQVMNGIGRPQDAFNYLQSHNALAAELAKQESMSLRREMETKYLTKEKDLQLSLQELQIGRAKRQKLLFGLGLMALTAISSLLFLLSRNRKKTNRELAEKNMIINRSLEEKDVLLREIHHRVKNNLQVISALLELQTKFVTDEGTVTALRRGQDRVESMALIHKDLYQHDNLSGVNTKIYFEKLINNLLESYQVEEGKISIETEIDSLLLDVDTMVPLGLLINELISNAIKHAFDNKGGKIFVRLTEGDEALNLLVEDNGKGFSETETNNNQSFGYSLIQSFVRRLEASMHIEHSEGTRIKIKIQSYTKSGVVAQIA